MLLKKALERYQNLLEKEEEKKPAIWLQTI